MGISSDGLPPGLLGSERLIPPTPIRDMLDAALREFREAGGPSAEVQSILVSPAIYYGLQQEMFNARIFPSESGLVFRGIPLEKADINTIIFIVKPYLQMSGSYVAVPVREWLVMKSQLQLSSGIPLYESSFIKTKPIEKEEPVRPLPDITKRKLRD